MNNNEAAAAEFEAAYDGKVSPRIQAQVLRLLTAVYYKLCAIEERLPRG